MSLVSALHMSLPMAVDLLQALRSGGQALVAAKSYYFGVGGSSNAFKNAVEAKGGFSIRSLAVEGGGASIQREIIVLQKT